MFELLINLLVFIFGLIVGSFLNCVIYRLKTDKSFFEGRSFCPLCKHELAWLDLIPVVSFLMLKGKCNYCHKPISIHYPLVELFTGLLFLLVFHHAQYSILYALYNLVIVCFLIVIFVYDLKHYIIPDKVIYPAILVSGIFNIFLSFYTPYALRHTLYAALGASSFFLLIYLMSRGQWLGFGDVKLAFFMGLYLGFPNILVALFLSFFIGAVVGLTLISWGKKTLKSEVPFGPFLVTGTIIALFCGEQLINWYLNLLYG